MLFQGLCLLELDARKGLNFLTLNSSERLDLVITLDARERLDLIITLDASKGFNLVIALDASKGSTSSRLMPATGSTSSLATGRATAVAIKRVATKEVREVFMMKRVGLDLLSSE